MLDLVAATNPWIVIISQTKECLDCKVGNFVRFVFILLLLAWSTHSTTTTTTTMPRCSPRHVFATPTTTVRKLDEERRLRRRVGWLTYQITSDFQGRFEESAWRRDTTTTDCHNRRNGKGSVKRNLKRVFEQLYCSVSNVVEFAIAVVHSQTVSESRGKGGRRRNRADGL